MPRRNMYNDLQVEAEKLHGEEFQSEYHLVNRSLVLTGGLMKLRLWEKFIDSGLIRDWFHEFHIYWVEVLHARHLKFHDFFHLYSEYRKRFQSVELEDEKDGFLEVWQRPENIYILFGAVYKYALSPVSFYRFRKYISRANDILEYGCGVAPITYSALKYGKSSYKRKSFSVADIGTHAFHFAKWRFSNMGNVSIHDLSPRELPHFQKKYDLIFMIEVLEHLPNPLEALQNLYDYLKRGGVFIFDFILGEGEGLDTRQALKDRESIISFIDKNFIIERGRLEVNKSMGETIAKKR